MTETMIEPYRMYSMEFSENAYICRHDSRVPIKKIPMDRYIVFQFFFLLSNWVVVFSRKHTTVN